MWWAVFCSARGENPTMKLVVLRSSLNISSVQPPHLQSSPDGGAEIGLGKFRFDWRHLDGELVHILHWQGAHFSGYQEERDKSGQECHCWTGSPWLNLRYRTGDSHRAGCDIYQPSQRQGEQHRRQGRRYFRILSERSEVQLGLIVRKRKEIW